MVSEFLLDKQYSPFATMVTLPPLCAVFFMLLRFKSFVVWVGWGVAV